MPPTGPICENDIVSLPASGALAANRHIKIDSNGQLAYAGLGEDGIGLTQGIAAAAGDMVPVKLWTASGTFAVTLSAAAATIGGPLYSAANGKFSNSSSGTTRLVQLEAGTGDGSVIAAARV